MTSSKPRHTQTAIVRCWIEQQTEETVYRFRVENPRTGEHWSFVSLTAVLTFLADYLTINEL